MKKRIPWNKGLLGYNAGKNHYNFGKKRPGVGGRKFGFTAWNKDKENPLMQGEKHPMWKGGTEGWKQDRKSIFNRYGWEIIFIDGEGIKNNEILSLLKGGD